MLGGEITVSDSTLTKVLKNSIQMFRKAETVGRFLDQKNLINRDEKSKLNDCIGVYKNAFTGVLEIHNISKSVQQGKTIFY